MSSKPHSPSSLVGRASPRPLSRRAVLAGLAAFAASEPIVADEVRPLYGGRRPALPKMGPSFREEVHYSGNQPAGSVLINATDRTLLLVLSGAVALSYRISVGRDGFGWTGSCFVGAKVEWPDWRPPAEMRARQPDLPELVPAGPYNPLGARALYLYRDGRDTLYRIHGTNDPDGVGFDNTSGCFRLTNTDIVDLYDRVPIGTEVTVSI